MRVPHILLDTKNCTENQKAKVFSVIKILLILTKHYSVFVNSQNLDNIHAQFLIICLFEDVNFLKLHITFGHYFMSSYHPAILQNIQLHTYD